MSKFKITETNAGLKITLIDDDGKSIISYYIPEEMAHSAEQIHLVRHVIRYTNACLGVDNV